MYTQAPVAEVNLETGQLQCTTIFGGQTKWNFPEWRCRLLGWAWSNPRRDNGYGSRFNTLLLVCKIMKCLLVTGTNSGEAEGSSWGTWIARSGQAFHGSSIAQENLALLWSKTRWCLLTVTAARVFLSKSTLSRRVARSRPVVNLKGQTLRSEGDQFKKVLMALNVKEAWNLVRDAEILWKRYPSKYETAGKDLETNRLWVLDKGSARNGRRAGCRKARILEV